MKVNKENKSNSMKKCRKKQINLTNLSIHRNFINTFYEFKVLRNLIIMETFNVNFHNKFI